LITQKLHPAAFARGGFRSPLALPATDFFGEAGASCPRFNDLSSCIAPRIQGLDLLEHFSGKQI